MIVIVIGVRSDDIVGLVEEQWKTERAPSYLYQQKLCVNIWGACLGQPTGHNRCIGEGIKIG